MHMPRADHSTRDREYGGEVALVCSTSTLWVLAHGYSILAANFGCNFNLTGGRGEIRTHGTLAGTPVFKTGALNHSATLPALEINAFLEQPGADCHRNWAAGDHGGGEDIDGEAMNAA